MYCRLASWLSVWSLSKIDFARVKQGTKKIARMFLGDGILRGRDSRLEQPRGVAPAWLFVFKASNGERRHTRSQIFAQALEERMPDLAFSRFCAVFDFGQQLRLDPNAAMGDPLGIGLGFPDQRCQARPPRFCRTHGRLCPRRQSLRPSDGRHKVHPISGHRVQTLQSAKSPAARRSP